jgi:hypothetical protein
MPRLPYTPEGFGKYLGGALTGSAEIQFSWEELCRAAVTVGRRSWADVLKFGTYSLLEALWRVAIVRANLVETYDGRLRPSRAYSGLDPSEKAGVSYFLGLALTKLVAEKLFGVPWLLHLDVYKQQLAPDLAFPEKPDFVGMDPWLLWIVVESKGRSGGLPKRLLDVAKRQVQSVRRIGGQFPALRIAVATYFSSTGLRARMRDPNTPEPDAIDIELNPEQLARAYYRPVVEMIRASSVPPARRQVDGRADVITPLAGLDARLGLEERIFTWYIEGQPNFPTLLADRRSGDSILRDIEALASLPEQDRSSKTSHDEGRWDAIWSARLRHVRRTGEDGVTVELGPSWDEEYMRREPEDRAG